MILGENQFVILKDKNYWESILSNVEKENLFMKTMLEKGMPLGVENGIYIIAFLYENRAHYHSTNTEYVKRLLRSILIKYNIAEDVELILVAPMYARIEE